MARPYNLYSYVHKGNVATELMLGVNGMLLSMIADIQQELLNISMKHTSKSLSTNFRNIFGSRELFSNKVEQAMALLRNAKVTEQEYPALYQKLKKMIDLHEESYEIIKSCVELIDQSKLPDDEKDDLKKMFRDAELNTKKPDTTNLWPDTAKVLKKFLDQKAKNYNKPHKYDEILKELEKIGEKHLKTHSMYEGTKEIVRFIQRSSLPIDEKEKLISVFKTSRVKDAPLQHNTYTKLLQLMKDKGLVYDAKNRKGVGYLNEDIRILVSTSGEYHILYPEEYVDLFEGIPDRNGKRSGGLLMEAAIRSGERIEYSVSQLRSIAITQEKVNGLFEHEAGQNSIFKLENLPAALTEKVIRENYKKSKLIMAREESMETRNKDLPLSQRKFNLYIIAGDTNEKKDKNYSELIKLVTTAAYLTSGHVGKEYENPRMLVNMREHLAVTKAVESVSTTKCESGYLIPMINTKKKDPLTGMNVNGVRTGNYIHFNRHTITEYGEDQSQKRQVHFRSTDSMKNTLYLNYKSGSGEKVFVSDKEYNSVMAKVPAFKKHITAAMQPLAKEDIKTYIKEEQARIEQQVNKGYKNERNKENDQKKYILLGKLEESINSDDMKASVGAVLYGQQLRYMDESLKGKFEKDDAKESGNRNHAKDMAMAREVLLNTSGKITSTDIFNVLMSHNLTENHSFNKKPDDLSKDQTNFLYHEISRMGKNGAFDLTAPYVDRNGLINGAVMVKTVKNALSEIRACVKTTDEIDAELSEKMEMDDSGYENQASFSRQEAAAFEYGSYLAEQAEPEGEARDGEIDVSEAKIIFKELHDSIDSHIEESDSLFEGASLDYEKTEDSMDYNEVDYSATVKKLQAVSRIESELSEVEIISRDEREETEAANRDDIDFSR